MGETRVRWEKPAYGGKNQHTVGKTNVHWEKPPYAGKNHRTMENQESQDMLQKRYAD